MNPQFPKDYSPGSGPGTGAGPGLGYIETLPPQSGSLRYNQEPTAPSLALDQNQQQYNLSLYQPPPDLNTGTQYPQDGGGNYYQPIPNICPPTGGRPRFGSSNTSAPGIDNTPRTTTTTTLPHPGPHVGTHIGVREQYSHATPSFRRPSEHSSARSPSFPGSHYRRNPMSPSPSLASAFTSSTGRMGNPFGGREQESNIPPLDDIKTLGTLQYQDVSKTNVELGISGVIDKGFFMAENEWTCYRRNYFSCVCSYSLTPYLANVPIELKLPGSRPATPVCGFAMGISAVVAENDQHTIELVQHTPKRDKGPTKTPPKVPLMAKQDAGARHVGFFGNNPTAMGGQSYPDGWVPDEASGNGPQTEYTFERVQFKQATQNNGKRRAAQQYYHIMVELHANTGTPTRPNYVKIAYRKSAKMIVRGRSPGHYKSDRRGSSSNPPSGTSGNSHTYGLMGGVRDFGGNPLMQYGGQDGSQGSLYGAHRHYTLPPAAVIPPEDEKAMDSSKGFHYYPAMMGDDQANPRVALWGHPNDSSESMVSMVGAGNDMNDKVKPEYENGSLPRMSHTVPAIIPEQSRACRLFESKSTSAGYYPTVVSPSSMGISMQ